MAFAPGFTETTSAVSWLAARAATFGFVTIAFNVNNTLTDLPSPRGQQLQAALSFVTTQSREAGRADASRLAVAGHSMGGGATLFASRDLPTLKAAVGLAPWSPGASFDDVTVPSLEIAAQNDIIAPINDNARPLYRSLPAGTPKQYVELKGADHFVTNSPARRWRRRPSPAQALGRRRRALRGLHVREPQRDPPERTQRLHLRVLLSAPLAAAAVVRVSRGSARRPRRVTARRSVAGPAPAHAVRR